MKKVLEINNLNVSFKSMDGEVKAVRGINFDLYEHETLAIVGESGSGKSVTAQSIMRLIPTSSAVIEGSAIYDEMDLIQLPEKRMESIRGKEISMIFQDPMTSLNPTMRIGSQLTEGLIKHQNLSVKEAKERALGLLKLVGIPDPETRINQYSHQFSGGMRQRVVIAIALACNPKILVADEPTTALDVTIQSQILQLMKDLQKKTGTSIILITHDLGVVANAATRVAVMYSGKIVETGTVDEIFYNPKHPYTWGLLGSMPKLDGRKGGLKEIPGSPPELLNPPTGCPFVTRCPYAMQICQQQNPDFAVITDTQQTACWLQNELAPHVEPPEDIFVGGANKWETVGRN